MPRPALAWLALGAVLLAGLALALDIPPAPPSGIHDAADLLDPAAERELAALLREFEAESSNEVAVATFPSLDGESLEDFTIRLAEAWKPGQADRDNGVLLAVFVGDRRVRIEVGYGLEGALPDALARRIIQNEIVDPFRAGRYAQGIRDAVVAIMAATRGEYEAPPRRRQRDEPSPFLPILLYLGLFLLISVVGRLFFGGRRRRRGGHIVWDVLEGVGHVVIGGGFRGGGGGGFGGGGGGFGGGGFGGGGSSGGW